MTSVNRVYLLGFVGRRPEIGATTDGRLVASFSMCTHDRFQLQDGTWSQRTEWHNITAFGDQADQVRTGIKSGDPVLLEGHLRTHSWPDRQGGDKRHKTEVVVDAFHPISTLSNLLPSAKEVA